MIKKSIIFICLILLSCKKEKVKVEDLELVIENNELKASKKNGSSNIITYSIKNNGNEVYYVNNFSTKMNHPLSISKESKLLRVFQETKECKYYPVFRKTATNILQCELLNYQQKILNNKNLGYKDLTIYDLLDLNKVNFFIYPKQKIYFEYYVAIDNCEYDRDQRSFTFIDYNSKENFYATLSIVSDSSNYKKILPRDILKTLKVNNVKLYHGMIESKNKVPIKIVP